MLQRILLNSALVLSVIVNIYFFAELSKYSDSKNQQNYIETQNKLDTAILNMDAKYEAVRADLNRIEGELVINHRASKAVSKLTTINTPKSEETLIEESEDNFEQSTVSEDSIQDKFAKKMMADPEYDPVKVVEEQFDQQDVDFQWSSSYQEKLLSLFGSTDGLSSMPLKEVNCKSTICKVSIYAGDLDPFSAASRIAESLSTQEWRDPEASFVFNHLAQDGVINFYIGKDGNSFEL